MRTTLIELRHVGKSLAGVRALDDASLTKMGYIAAGAADAVPITMRSL